MNIDNYDKIEHENGDILLKKKAVDLDWMPKVDELLFYVDSDGAIEQEVYTATNGEKLIFDFNVGYASEKQAKKAAELMRRSNAYIRACLLVDPDFVPDWNDVRQGKWSSYYSYDLARHRLICSYELGERVCYVSSREKAAEVIKLLVKWGVK